MTRLGGTGRWLALAVCLSVVTVMPHGAAGGHDEGGAGEPIVIGAMFDLSGPTSDMGIPYGEGVRDYFAWRDGKDGDAPAIELHSADFAYRVPEAERLYTRFVSEGAVAIIGWGVADTEALRPRVNADEIPFMSASYPEILTDPRETPFNFVPATTYSDQIRIALQWIADQEQGHHTEVAVFHHDSPFGTSPLQDGQSYIEDRRLDLGYRTYAMRAGATDFLAELEQAKKQGAAYIVVHNVASPAAKLANNVASGDFDMRLVCLNWCGSEIFTRLTGAGAEGVAAVMPFAPPSVDVPGMRDMQEFLAAKGESLDDKGVHYVQGWYTAATMAGAAEEAARAGEVTGPAIRHQLETSAGVSTGEVTTEPIRFRPESHKGMAGARMFVVEGGRWTSLSGPLRPQSV